MTHILFSKSGYRIVRIGLGMLFIVSGLIKVSDLLSFAETIRAFAVLPYDLGYPAALVISTGEILAGIGLVSDIKASLGMIFLMLMLFVAVLGYAVFMGYDIDCGCFGPEDPEAVIFKGLKAALVRDLVLVAMILYLYLWRFKQKHRPRSINRLITGGKIKMKLMRKVFFSGILILGVLSLAMPASALFDGKFKQEVEKEEGAVKLVREVQRGGYDLVTTAELDQWIKANKDMVIVDTMPYDASYKKAHVPGAVQFLFPIPEMETWQAAETDNKTREDFEKLLGPDKEKTIVIYCGFVKCTRSHNGAMWAKKIGYKNVYRFSGGIYAWQGADLAIESE